MNLFRSKKSEAVAPQIETAYDPFGSTRSKLNTFLSDRIGQKGPLYTGDRVAPVSGLEQKSIDIAEKAADRPATGANYSLASEEIKKTLSGDYDPSTSPYYQAVKAEA